jgi:hypothetical protein
LENDGFLVIDAYKLGKKLFSAFLCFKTYQLPPAPPPPKLPPPNPPNPELFPEEPWNLLLDLPLEMLELLERIVNNSMVLNNPILLTDLIKE